MLHSSTCSPMSLSPHHAHDVPCKNCSSHLHCIVLCCSLEDATLRVTVLPSLGKSIKRLTSSGGAAAAAPPAAAAAAGSSAAAPRSAHRSLSLAPGADNKSVLSAVSTMRSKGAPSLAASASAAQAMAKGKLAQLDAAMSVERRLEHEAERLRLVHQLLHGAAPVLPLLMPEPSSVSAAADAVPALDGSPAASRGSSAASKPRRPVSAPVVLGLVAAHYVVDFGYVTKGTSKSRKVKLSNISTQAVGGRKEMGRLGAGGIASG